MNARPTLSPHAQTSSEAPFVVQGLTLDLPLQRLLRRRRYWFRIEPDQQARASLAQEFDLLSLEAISFEAELTPEGAGGWRLVGRLEARVEQACVVTGKPVPSAIAVAVLRRYLPDYGEPTAREVELPDDLSLEPLVPLVDAGAILREELSLALPDWPRADDAEAGDAPERTGFHNEL